MTDDLPELLSQLGLIKYIDVFEQQEVTACREEATLSVCDNTFSSSHGCTWNTLVLLATELETNKQELFSRLVAKSVLHYE